MLIGKVKGPPSLRGVYEAAWELTSDETHTTTQAVAERAGVSRSTAHLAIRRLVNEGLMEATPGSHRTIRVIVPNPLPAPSNSVRTWVVYDHETSTKSSVE